MLKETIPENVQYKSVMILDSSLRPYVGRAAFKEWTPREAFMRGFRRSAKIIAILFILPLPLAFMEPFAFMAWGSLTLGGLILVLGPYLHLKYWGESRSFFFVDGECPHCHASGRLNPYISTAFLEEFT
ncbi:MAG: hypothetical protein ABI041_08670, partial [Bdellovibrionia bacterium]